MATKSKARLLHGGSIRPDVPTSLANIKPDPAQSGPTTSRTKRKAEVDSVLSYPEVTVVKTKKRKTEEDFHRSETENSLRDAREFASEGNRDLMEHCLRKAQEHQNETSHRFSEFNLHVAEIRKLLQDEGRYHAKQCNYNLKEATNYALEGNRSLMNHCLEMAQKHAQKKGTDYMKIYHQRATAIRNSLRLENEVSFYDKAIQERLDSAKMFSLQGNRKLMEFCLKQAKEKAKKVVGRYNSDFVRKENQIRSLLASEVEFHRKEFREGMASAEQYADEGNRGLMEYSLKQAREHAMQAGCWDAAAQEQATRLQKSMATAPTEVKVKKEEPDNIVS
jgi:hypothetical protein